ncbi:MULTISPECIES: SDR family NAD(P)-dependent oxidoreductase [Novosphingobium]|uniref:SDR family NAD(P)-dependent oxidoreductase n=1 Tax=Novosphingobium TaxID=165696 RepID=UPI0022F28EEB|nr:SDR family oxidoreductase [Novosphingobium resinovorum]GLK44003.1 short-chain dehydrogenase [Novosphingobium resinovorum]
MSGFEGKVAVVTGAASGLGAASARLLAARGATVMLFDRDVDGLTRIREELATKGLRVDAMAGDVSNSANCDAAVAKAVAGLGGVDILVNNAGFGRLGPTEDMTDDFWRTSAAVNIDGYFYMARAAIRTMLAAGSGGAIVNMASIYGLVGIGSHLAYCAAKGAIVNMTRSLALEYAGCGIRVNAVCPGVILTPLIQSTLDDAGQARFADLHPMKRMGQPEEVARGVAFLAGDEASFITGVVLPVDGGYTAQ